MPPEINLPTRLRGLFQACETECVHGCCGIEAFHFSPLHIASHLSHFSGCVSPEDIAAIEAELDQVSSVASKMPANAEGFICSISDTNQWFTEQSLKQLFDEIRKNLKLAPKVVAFSDELVKGAEES